MISNRIGKIHRLLSVRHPVHCVPVHAFRAKNLTEKDLLVMPANEDEMTPLARAAKAYHDELLALSDDELDNRIADVERLAEEAREAAHPFNIPAAMASDEVYEYWSKAAYWSIEEAVALALGRDPKKVICKTRWVGERVPRFHPEGCGPQYEALYELARRAMHAKQIAQNTRPGAFLAWAKRNRITVPERLETIVLEHGHHLADWKSAYDQQLEKTKALEGRVAELQAVRAPMDHAAKSQSAVTRERNTLLKIILGLAMDQYGYQPHAPRNATAGEMASHLLGQGISVSEDTIRKYLNEASEFAPPRDTA